jgi:uncharacterized membrane protein YagU involved in acid resistance
LKAIVGGLLGTIAITFLMYFVAPFMLGHPMDVAKMLGDFLGTTRNVGMAVHYINGTIIFPLIFAGILWNLLPGGPTSKGITWGVILWFLSQAIVTPMMGGGFFSANSGGVMAVAASLLGHLVYGAILGAVTGRPAIRTSAEERRGCVRRNKCRCSNFRYESTKVKTNLR